MKTSFIYSFLMSQPSLIKFALNCLCINACLFRHIYFEMCVFFKVNH